MDDHGFVILDTKAFDAAISKRDALTQAYNELDQEYDRIIKTLMENWKGRGAAAFLKDAKTVKSNIVGIFDTLKTLCDTLEDCRSVFAECDAGLGEFNRSVEL